MSQAQDDLRGIVDFLKDENARRNSREPLEKPSELDDPKADPNLRAAAERWYVGRLLERRTLTPAETAYLGSEIAKHLKGGQ
jgi:hypothetical protein